MATITKKELIDRIAARARVKRTTVKMVTQEFLEQIIDELKKGNRLEFRDFGVFEVKNRAARQAQNPKTLERVTVPAKRTVKFKIGRLMRENIEVASVLERAAAEKAGPRAVERTPLIEVQRTPELRPRAVEVALAS